MGMHRIVIIGTSGSGKSTLGETLAHRLGVTFVELDSLFWQPGWTQVSTEVFRERVSRALADESWVVMGNYSRARDLIWSRADTLLWLDYSFPLVIWRLFRRTVRRIISQEELWGGNHESFRKQFLSRDSLFIWVLQTHWRYRHELEEVLHQPEYTHLHVIRFKTPRETERWLETVEQTHESRA